jgi:Calcineurin-like phosphoesterase
MAFKRVFKSYFINLITAFLFILGLVAFEFWDHHFPLPVHDRNKREITRIKVDPTDLSFAVFGDHKGHEFVFEPLLRDVDHDKGIAFAVELGDLVRQGRRWFYRRLLDQIEKNLTRPFLAVIGNHDLYRGSANYQEIFGPTYTSFQIGESDFIFLDTSARFHFDPAQRQWLETELQRSQTSKVRFVFMHVPLFDPRKGRAYKCLSEKDGKDLLDLFRRYNVTHLFASHIHGYFSGRWEGVPYTITGGAGAGLHGKDPQHFFHHYIKVRVSSGNVEVAVRRIDVQESSMKDFLSFMRDFGPEWGLLTGLLISLFALGLSIKKDYSKDKGKPV